MWFFISAVAGCEHGAGAAGSGGARPADTIRRVKVKMSSVSAQGVVERASAELSRRITGTERTYFLYIFYRWQDSAAACRLSW